MDELHQSFMHLSLTFDCPETFAPEALDKRKQYQHWISIPEKVLLCIYLMFKGVQRASACEDIFFIFMV